jgi:hypothetical protein
MTNTIGYVSTERTQTTEEMNTSLDLNSSVEINFKSDYLPLNRMAGSATASRIRQNSLNPEAEEQIASQERIARANRNATSDDARRQSLDRDLAPPPPPAPAAAPAQTSRPAAPPLARRAVRRRASKRTSHHNSDRRAARGPDLAPCRRS